MNGLVLLGNGDGTFRVTQPSGFYVPGDGKALVAILAEGQLRIIASQNNGKLKAFEFLDRIGIQTVKKEEQTAFIHFKDGSARRVEMNTAGGYLSLSSAFFTVPESAGRVTINNGENGKDRILQ